MIAAILLVAATLLNSYPEISMTDIRNAESDTVSGNTFAAIQAAVPELARFDLDVTDYIIRVVPDGDHLVVIFSDPAIQPGVKGSGGKLPGVEVVLDPRDLRIVNSHLVR